MRIKIKKFHPDAKIPTYAHSADAGVDLYCTTINRPEDRAYIEYDTGIGVEIPDGHVGLIFPRSSISNTPHYLSNAVGVVDSNYRGPIKFRFKTDAAIYLAMQHEDSPLVEEYYKEGDRVGQLIVLPYPKLEFEEVDELTSSERGEKGYGSTGK